MTLDRLFRSIAVECKLKLNTIKIDEINQRIISESSATRNA